MEWIRKIRLLAVALALGLAPIGSASWADAPDPVGGEGTGAALAAAAALGSDQLPTSPLVIRTADGSEHRFTVELASTPEERAQGLMFRKALAPDAGMLFDFKELGPVAMWMKDTLIPLDMLFISRDGRIVRVAERTVPLTLTPIPSGEPVLAVLEVNSGTTARLGIKPGDRAIHPIFQP